MEFLTALSTEEFNFIADYKDAPAISEREKARVIEKVNKHMNKVGISVRELFARIDRNANGEISMMEMKFTLLDLQLELSEIVAVMKIFDIN